MSVALVLWSVLCAGLTLVHGGHGRALLVAVCMVCTALAGAAGSGEGATGATSLRARFLAFDDALAALGMPPLTTWWRDGIGDWLDRYERDGVLELWACVGRGAAKSTALYKLSLFFSLFVSFDIPIGERHYAIVLSRLKEEAAKAVPIIAHWLTRLRVPHRVVGDVIEFADMPRGIRVVAASVPATSGWRAFFVGRDERSKWASEGATDLDAAEIDTSASAMTATHARAPVVSAGSAWGAFGPFYEAIVGGTDAGRHVLGPTPTWIAAPHITEESTRQKERDPRKHDREYRCVFSGSVSDVLTKDLVDPAFEKPKFEMTPLGPLVLVVDPSSGKHDTFAFGLGGWWTRKWAERDMWLWKPAIDPNPGHDAFMQPVKGHLVVQRDERGYPIPNPEYGTNEPVFALTKIGGYEGKFGTGTTGETIVRTLADRFLPITNRVVSDQREELGFAALFTRHGFRFRSLHWTNPNKVEAVSWIARLFKERRIGLEPHDGMRTELLNFREKLQPSGAITYEGRKSDDYVALLITSALADMAGLFGGSPNRAPSGRTDLGPENFLNQ